jgi:uncharacterized protein (DUF3084 family)
MSRTGIQRSLVRSSRREVIDVPETRPADKSLDLLLKLRKQRIERYEQERRRTRVEWRQQRTELRDLKKRRRQALQDAKDFWKQARDQFLSMVTTSGQYRKAKAIYERMKQSASQLYEECQGAVSRSRLSRTAFFEACKALRDAQRQHEKLGMLRDEIRLLNRQSEE